jgi:microcystin-dependent protein
VIGESGSVKVLINDAPAVALNTQAVTPVGGSQPHENCQPFLCINFIISLFGVFPSQT